MDLAGYAPAFNDALTACYENSSAYLDTTDFDPMYQQFVLLDPNQRFVLINTSDIIDYESTLITSAAIFGAQFGAVLGILVVVVLLTTAEKRKTLPFIFNTSALVCDFVRCILQIVQLNSALNYFPVQALSIQDPPNATQIMAVSVADTLLTFLLFVSIELALIIQVHVICTAAAGRKQRLLVTCFTVVVGSVAIAFRLYLMALNIHGTITSNDTKASQDQLSRAQSMSNIASIISIALFSIVFCYKLYLAIKNRRRLGIRKFGYMEIIMIGGGMTLVVPTIFAILDYFVFLGAQFGSVVDTLVAISLPVTGIWAASNLNGTVFGDQHAAVMARPENPANRQPRRQVDSGRVSDTLVAPAGASLDGLRGDEHRFRSRHDLADDSSTTIDRYFTAGVAQGIELERLPLPPAPAMPRRLPPFPPEEDEEEDNEVASDALTSRGSRLINGV
ncbi:hypothetical protein AMS68_001656 [Peltaster fructicola]|uniref:Uncharacterized protein n=1 Tax=Peltaster fructicola TaxID=286661 RepID=A0A6H0XND6_9PEZI|nr:hypothetical protein AMS68_001656 [Peltaster fructicola]